MLVLDLSAQRCCKQAGILSIICVLKGTRTEERRDSRRAKPPVFSCHLVHLSWLALGHLLFISIALSIMMLVRQNRTMEAALPNGVQKVPSCCLSF